MKIRVNPAVIDYIGHTPEKDQRIIGEHLDRLSDHPNAPGDIKKLKTRKPRWRMHIGSKYTVFYFVNDDTVFIDHIMSQELAHKKYGKI